MLKHATALAPASVHIPVLLHQATEIALGLKRLYDAREPLFLDATFGGGSYTRRILQVLPKSRVVCVDKDPVAYTRAKAMAAEFRGRIVPILSGFGSIEKATKTGTTGPLPIGMFDGVVFDLGMSSDQIACRHRGFSYRINAPLDMRFNASDDKGETNEAVSAATVVNELGVNQLATIFQQFGQDANAFVIAEHIGAARKSRRIQTTHQLLNVIRDAVSATSDNHHQTMRSVARTFQALRIHVNDELGELTRGLNYATRLLVPGTGRMAVVSFHSLEDKIVRRFLHDNSTSMKGSSLFKDLSPAIKPTADEIRSNPRCKSAILRYATRYNTFL